MNYTNRREFSARKSVALPSFASPSRPHRLRWTIPYRAIAPVAMFCDAVIIFAMGLLACVAYHLAIADTLGDLSRYGALAIVTAILFIGFAQSRGLYSLPELLNFKSQVGRIAIKWFGIMVFLATIAFAMKIGEAFSRGVMTAFAAFGFTGLIASRALWRVALADGLAVRKFSGRRIALIAESGSASDSGIVEALARHGLQLAQHFVLPAAGTDPKKARKVIIDAIASLRRSQIEEVVVAANVDRWQELRNSVAELRVLPLPVNLVPVGPSSDLFGLPSHTIGDTVTIELQRGPRTFFERVVKRIFDVVAAVVMTLLLLPLFLMTAIAIKLDSRGPIIFSQRRCGFNGRPFFIYKFRTMSVLEDGDGVVAAKVKDSRVTRIGNWLRRSSIDELPQLYNVLKGEMSIVGPRPFAIVHDNQFDQMLGDYAYRHHAKPGLTGWAQIHGLRGSMTAVAEVEERNRMDLWYIDNWSLLLDCRIILQTVVEVLRGRNAY